MRRALIVDFMRLALLGLAAVGQAGIAQAETAAPTSAKVTTSSSSDASAVGAKLQQYLYVLRLVPRLHDEGAWTDADNAAVSRHFAQLKEAAASGRVILAGRTLEPGDRTFGLVIFEAPDEADARKFMESDPAVVAGVMTATLHPYAVALQRKNQSSEQ